MAKLPGAIAGARIVGERFVRSQRQANPEGRMPVMDHIRELRDRVVKMLLAVTAGMVVGDLSIRGQEAEGPLEFARALRFSSER